MSNELIFWAVVLLQIELIIAIIPWKKVTRSGLKGAVFIDTSSLIDGRILAAAATGFIPQKLVIPASVMAELQLLADGSDPDKRSKARYGIDVATMLRENSMLRVIIFEDGAARSGVDDRLRELARKYKGYICTVDYNLNKVAGAEGIQVLNVNELAGGLRVNHLPGEKLSLTITQKGNDAHQGIGHLADGSMVVVEQASGEIGKTITVEIIRSLQTAAGRMLFAKKNDATRSKNQTAKTSGKSNSQGRKKRPEQNAHTEKHHSPKPPKQVSKSSASREASLVELIDSQSNE